MVLVDHRFHGDTGPAPPPHTVDACADDVAALAAVLGAPDLVLGHSFGGKVALSYADRHGVSDLVIVDSVPGAAPESAGNSDVVDVLRALRGTSTPAPDRGSVSRELEAQGLSQPLVRWLATSLRRSGNGWDWVYDLDAIEDLLRDYLSRDLWTVLEEPTFERGLVVRALRSDRWSTSDVARLDALPATVRVEALDAGHWVHVDAPDGLFDALRPLL